MEELLKTLLTVLEKGSISAAAEAMNYSPSGVSRMIERLERELDVKLLIRTRDGAAPTDACRILKPRIERCLFEENGLRQEAAAIRGAKVGTVTIGTAYRFVFRGLTPIMDDFRRENHDRVEFRFRTGFSTDLLQDLSDYKIDLAVISRRERAARWVPVTESDMVAWVPAKSGLAARGTFPLSCFSSVPYIDIFGRTDTDNARILDEEGVAPDTRLYAADDYTAFTMVEAGLGCSFNERCNSVFESPDVAVLPVDPPKTVEIGIAAGPQMSPAAAAFLEYLRPRIGELAAAL